MVDCSSNGARRPRKAKSSDGNSAFDELRDRKVTVRLDGVDRKLSVAEALLHKMYQLALGGNKSAVRLMLKEIAEHEAGKAPARCYLPTMVFQYDKPRGLDDAMLILGIATEVPDAARTDGRACLVLEPWAVSAALARGKNPRPSAKEIRELKRRTRDPDTVAWPSGVDE